MLREMNHRIKNLLAMVMSMIDASAASAENANELAETVKGRLFALAKAHDLTLPDPRESIEQKATTFRALVSAITMPHQQGTKERAPFEGPDVPVTGLEVSSLALLLHEFSTNAAKYGALSRPSGWIEICCFEEGPELQVIWKEQGGPTVDGSAGKHRVWDHARQSDGAGAIRRGCRVRLGERRADDSTDAAPPSLKPIGG